MLHLNALFRIQGLPEMSVSHKTFVTSIVGRHAYPNVQLSPGQALEIVHEKNNAFDAHALAVQTLAGEVVGHLKRSLALYFYTQHRSLKRIRATVLRTSADVSFRHPIRVIADYD